MQPLKLEILEEGRQSGARKALQGQVIRPKARSAWIVYFRLGRKRAFRLRIG
jgi:hypothetical protein